MAGNYSERARSALAAFGLTIGDDRAALPNMRSHAHALAERVRPGAIALLTGPSGAGKSTLLHELRALEPRVIDARALARSACAGSRRVVDLFTGDLAAALRLLGAAGLADARVFARKASELSDGQRARLGVALAMDALPTEAPAAPAPPLMVIDEFCSGLDDATARSLCITLRKWADRRRDVRIVCATARADLERWLAPDLCATISIEGACTLRARRRVRRHADSGVVITAGTARDYARLAHLHYRSGRPATVRRVLAARAGRNLVGVLVTSMPTLNGSWRDRAFSGRYTCGTKRARAGRINRELRCISRVIVDPRWRGRGVGSDLIRAYLHAPETRATEAIAAMGSVCPMFERAGMRPWTLEPTLRDRRLKRALTHLGISASQLAHHPNTSTAWGEPALRALRIWANASGATRYFMNDPTAMAHAAARCCAGRGFVYTWDAHTQEAHTQARRSEIR